MEICANKAELTMSTERVKEILESRGYSPKPGKGIVYGKQGCHDIKIAEGFLGGHTFKTNGWILSMLDQALKRSGAK